jgi:hypothetical protein
VPGWLQGALGDALHSISCAAGYTDVDARCDELNYPLVFTALASRPHSSLVVGSSPTLPTKVFNGLATMLGRFALVDVARTPIRQARCGDDTA